jgi:hypothetical protein
MICWSNRNRVNADQFRSSNCSRDPVWFVVVVRHDYSAKNSTFRQSQDVFADLALIGVEGGWIPFAQPKKVAV